MNFFKQQKISKHIIGDFIERVPNVSGTYDKEETLKLLEPHHQNKVAELGYKWENLWRAEQIHKVRVCHVPTTEHHKNNIIPNCDALTTNQRGTLLGIYVADCAAVYLIDEAKPAIGLIHSGRKGTELGITPATIKFMKEQYGSDPKNLKMLLSPCIRPPDYKVDIAKMIIEQALSCGITPKNIYDCKLSTASDLPRFYSYRIEKGKTGRMLALLGLKA